MPNELQGFVALSGKKEEEPEQLTPPKQSANTLFRFFRKRDYLFDALNASALIPRYYGENVDYLDIGHHQISYPMICFCDINIHRLSEHMSLYGEYGIAFSKSWGVRQGVQPLQYINKYSVLRRDFTSAFSSAIADDEERPANDYLLTQMLFMKPIEGTMPRDDKDISKNFTDECEWRYVPNAKVIELPQIVCEGEMASVGVLNKTISEHDDCWLKYAYSDIKYIILQTDADFVELCSLVETLEEGVDVKKKLLSKVIIWSDSKEDF